MATTLLRLYHKQAITNIMSALAYPYEQIITLSFLPFDDLRKHVIYQQEYILKEYGYNPKFINYDLRHHSIESILNQYKDCDIDITSNDQHDSMRLLSLIKHQPNIFYYCNRDNKFFSIKGSIQHLEVTNLHIRHSIESMGATVKKDSLHYTPKDFHNEQDRNTIKRIYAIFAPTIDKGCYGLIEAFPYVISKAKNNTLNFSIAKNNVSNKALDILFKLEAIHICQVMDKKNLIIKINPKYAHIFKVMGQILEMYCYVICLESKQFDDVKMSVTIDYNGHYQQSYYDATSEIDLICIKDNHPLYLSCKLNKIHQEDIYEIYTNATHFGGNSALAMVAVNKEAFKITEYLLNKAKELHVAIIEKAQLANLHQQIMLSFQTIAAIKRQLENQE